ncbi:MAG: hypothetical protein R2828_02760 [Saprospiraceae bacterium]
MSRLYWRVGASPNDTGDIEFDIEFDIDIDIEFEIEFAIEIEPNL